jgi:hypothetical protein
MPAPPPNVRRSELKRIFLYRGAAVIEVSNLVEDFMDKHEAASSVKAGIHLQLTWDEKCKLGIKTIACIDRTREEVRIFYRERRRERDRMKKKVIRMQTLKTKDISPRAKQLAAVLNGDWVQTRDLVKSVKQFRREPGRPLKRRTMMQVALRAGEELCEIGIAEQKIETSAQGGRARFLRWNPTTTYRREDFRELKRKGTPR